MILEAVDIDNLATLAIEAVRIRHDSRRNGDELEARQAARVTCRALVALRLALSAQHTNERI
jgi:hypothetical protein